MDLIIHILGEKKPPCCFPKNRQNGPLHNIGEKGMCHPVPSGACAESLTCSAVCYQPHTFFFQQCLCNTAEPNPLTLQIQVPVVQSHPARTPSISCLGRGESRRSGVSGQPGSAVPSALELPELGTGAMAAGRALLGAPLGRNEREVKAPGADNPKHAGLSYTC